MDKWWQKDLRAKGWTCVMEWSQPGPLGQTYVLRRGKAEVRLQEQEISAFITGLSYGKWIERGQI